MVTRMEGGVTYIENYDADCEAPPKGGNRLVSVNVSGQSQPTPFIYDGDGNLVKQIKPDGNKTLYVGGIYEVNKNAGGSVTGTKTYYPAAGAMRDGSTLYYVLKDHLGSASVLTDASGATVAGAETRYYPFGEARFTGPMVTDKLFTGQRQIAELGIYHYQARFYSPKLGRFLSADTIVPNPTNPQNLNRFSYVTNNPLRYIDPTGHRECERDSNGKCMSAKKLNLWNFAADEMNKLKKSKNRDSLETMVSIIDKAAQLYGTFGTMIPALSGIFLGMEESNALTVYNAWKHADACAAMGRPDCWANTPADSFDDSGFHTTFQDDQHQPYHFWAYLATAANTEGASGPASYLPGRIVSNAANITHEMIWPDGRGATWQDFALAQAGMNIGTLANMGAIQPRQLGSTIKDYVGNTGAPYVNTLIGLFPLQGNMAEQPAAFPEPMWP